jgi:hypothetical protein
MGLRSSLDAVVTGITFKPFDGISLNFACMSCHLRIPHIHNENARGLVKPVLKYLNSP